MFALFLIFNSLLRCFDDCYSSYYLLDFASLTAQITVTLFAIVKVNLSLWHERNPEEINAYFVGVCNQTKINGMWIKCH